MSQRPHIIQLRDPWQWDAPEPAERPAQFCAQRYFNRPTGLESGTRIQLVIDDLGELLRVRLNGHVLSHDGGQEAPWRADISQLLELRNLLQLDLKSRGPTPPAQARKLLAAGCARLEIREDESA